MQKSKKLVLFDIDGTLLRHFGREPKINVGWNRFGYALKQVFGIDVVPKPVTNYYGSVDRAILFDMAAQYGITKEQFDQNFEAVKAAVIHHAHTKERNQIYEAIPDAVVLLDALYKKPADYLLGVLTGNVEKMAHWKLKHVGVDPSWFQIFITSDEFEDRISLAKSTFAKVKKELGLEIDSSDTIVIGDAVGDVRCAHAIGAVSIVATTGGHQRDMLLAENPTLLVDSLMDQRVLILLGLNK